MTAPPSDRFPFDFGLGPFGDIPNDDHDRPLPHAQTVRSLVEQGVLADLVRR
jgi:hypothetical protein